MKLWQLLLVILLYVVYVVVGGVVFMALEQEKGEQTDLTSNKFLADWLGNNTCVSYKDLQKLLDQLMMARRNGLLPSNITGNEESTWNAYTSIYFAITVVTTIGYGNISPVTTGGRVFCVFFALIGIPFALIMFAEIGKKLAQLFTTIDSWCLKQCCQGCAKYPKISKFFRFMVIHAVFTVLLMIIPALIFNVVEKDWSIGNGIYYSFITLTTIGFGDYVAGFDQNSWGKPVYRLMVSAWIVIGLAWMSSVIALTQDHMGDVFKILTKKKKSENLQKVGPGRVSDDKDEVVATELNGEKHKTDTV